jgi:hypothetical protein
MQRRIRLDVFRLAKVFRRRGRVVRSTSNKSEPAKRSHLIARIEERTIHSRFEVALCPGRVTVHCKQPKAQVGLRRVRVIFERLPEFLTGSAIAPPEVNLTHLYMRRRSVRAIFDRQLHLLIGAQRVTLTLCHITQSKMGKSLPLVNLNSLAQVFSGTRYITDSKKPLA